MEVNRSFVFVVCGTKEHIDTLNFSLKALRLQTDLPILVVTDLSRNEYNIEHDRDCILDIRTPEEYNHHQASIYLKTGLHRFLHMEKQLFCYLDSDVIAVNNKVNQVFDHFVKPITFCSDHCRMNQFSGHAVNCGCFMPKELKDRIDHYRNQYAYLRDNEATINGLIQEWLNFKKQFPLEQAKNDWFNGLLKGRSDLEAKRARLMTLTNTSLPLAQLIFNYLFRVFPNYRRSIFSKRWTDINGNVLLDEGTDFHSFMNNRDFFFAAERNRWENANGLVCPEISKTFDSFFAEKGIRYQHSDEAWYTIDGELFWPNLSKLVEKEGSYWFDQSTDVWFNMTDQPVSLKECNHLQQAISDSFSIEVKNNNWQHWNGGVFLFNEQSVEFMNTWHEWTLEAFSKPFWKTRDQGTLIASAWKHGLQDHPLIPIEFNFIADYNHPTMLYLGNLTFRANLNNPGIRPSFIHIYHHWGDSDWEVWRDVKKHITSKKHVA